MRIRHPLREVGIRVAFGANDVIGGADLPVDIRQEPEAEVLCVGEDLVVPGCVERGTEDEAVGVGEVVGPVTQGLPFDGSTSGRCFRVPPEQDPVVAQLVEGDGVAVLIGQLERRRLALRWSTCEVLPIDESHATRRPCRARKSADSLFVRRRPQTVRLSLSDPQRASGDELHTDAPSCDRGGGDPRHARGGGRVRAAVRCCSAAARTRSSCCASPRRPSRPPASRSR